LDTLSHAYIAKANKEKRKNNKKLSSDERKQMIRDEKRRAEIMKANGKELTRFTLQSIIFSTKRVDKKFLYF